MTFLFCLSSMCRHALCFGVWNSNSSLHDFMTDMVLSDGHDTACDGHGTTCDGHVTMCDGHGTICDWNSIVCNRHGTACDGHGSV